MAFPDSQILTSSDLSKIVYSSKNSRRFCFILGSGASVESGIPSGNALEMRWMNCLMGVDNDGDAKAMDPERTKYFAEKLHEEKKLKHPFSDIEAEWNAAKADKRSMSSKYYFDIYLLRFHPDIREGYRYLENVMDSCNPSLGYHSLSLMLTAGNQDIGSPNLNRHNLVITTNFDSLVEDSLFLYTDHRPLVVSHESLAKFIDPNIQRPIVAKVHRGLMYDPLNSPDATDDLKPEWKETLDYAFKTYTPIVVGYGGGDGSLMKALQEATFRNGIYWCYRKASDLPDQKIQDFVEKQKGCLVGIDGFDALMLELGRDLYGNRISHSETATVLVNRNTRLLNLYEAQWKKLLEQEHIGKILAPINKAEEASLKKRKEEKKLTDWDYIRQGNACFPKKQYLEAIELYDQALHLNPNNAITYGNRALAHFYLKEYGKSIADNTKAIELDPKYSGAYRNRGNVYAEQEQHQQAIEEYTKAIELDPNHAATYHNRGTCLAKLGQHEQAIQDFDKAIELNPNDTFSYNNRGIIFGELGQHERAIQDFDKAIELNPNDATAYNNRGYKYLQLREFDKAIEDCKASLSINPQNPECHHTLASVYFELEQYQDAVDSFATAIEQFIEMNGSQVNLITTYKDRAKTYRALEKFDLAEADEAKAAELEAKENKDTP